MDQPLKIFTQTKEKEIKWKQKDPIENLRNYLIENNIASAEELEKIQHQGSQHQGQRYA
ncbi:acetoin:2%2C6-dichlorophenolindophenol oxidoreductase subunit alpha [Streptococcus pneumoniae]|nr:acetoin:2%2C6-dichlorophenolindophenol oxidoreductase subunit alpha [Streptococcus pneumoniae]